MKPHIQLAHQYWKEHLQKGDYVIDATCGNGQDTLVLANLALTAKQGKVYSLDIQEKAIQSTKQLLESHLKEDLLTRVAFYNTCHSEFPAEISPSSISLVVYNLGYLPKGDKTLTTMVTTTCKSIQNSFPLLKKGGLISIMCYPGHEEGEKEESTLLKMLSDLPSHLWNCCHHRWFNRPKSPSLILLEKLS